MSRGHRPQKSRLMILPLTALGDYGDRPHPQHLLPPFPVLTIPIDGPVQSLFQLHRRVPAQEPFGLDDRGGVPKDLPRTIADVFDKRARLLHPFHDQLRKAQNIGAPARPNVNNLSPHPLEIAMHQDI